MADQERPMTDPRRPRILIVGGGYVGLYTALRLERQLGHREADVTLVSPENFMVYQSLLPEMASGMLEPRHVVVPLRKALRRVRVRTGRLTDLDHARRAATIRPYEGDSVTEHYDHVVIALGSEPRVLPVPGLTDAAISFQTVTEALHLRNQVLGRMEAAVATADEAARRRALTFVFVGGGYSGVEALGELQSMAAEACESYDALDPSQLRWVLIEATDRILPMVDRGLAEDALDALRRRGVEVHLETVLETAEGGDLRLSDGTVLRTDTLVWVAGVQPNSLVEQLGLPTDEKGRLPVDACLRVKGTRGVWSAGDCAAVPDLVAGGTCPPSAQYAVREARQLGDNLAAAIRGQEPQPFGYDKLGELITLGRHQGVGQVRGRSLHGFLPWYLRRLYHVARIPTWNRKLRVWIDWTVSLAFTRDVVSLGSAEHPRMPFEVASERQ